LSWRCQSARSCCRLAWYAASTAST
jgi:hypothetical protein